MHRAAPGVVWSPGAASFLPSATLLWDVLNSVLANRPPLARTVGTPEQVDPFSVRFNVSVDDMTLELK